MGYVTLLVVKSVDKKNCVPIVRARPVTGKHDFDLIEAAQ
jgi:hypothetical protein